MDFHFKHFGPVKTATVQLGDLTLICGPNNSGKTYITYAIGIFLYSIWNKMALNVDEVLVRELMEKGAININLTDFIPLYRQTAMAMIANWKNYLPSFMAMPPNRCGQTDFSIDISSEELENKITSFHNLYIDLKFQITTLCELCLTKEAGQAATQVMLLNQNGSLPAFGVVKNMLGLCLAKIFNSPMACSCDWGPFMITSERTGAVLFKDQFTFSQKISAKEQNDTPRQFEFQGYQYPVAKELSYINRLNEIVSRESWFMQQRPDIIQFFNHLAGGRYIYDNITQQVSFSPCDNPQLALNLTEASSTVKSLLRLNFYLKHEAYPGQTLIYDEPELNLHPENQRQVARLLAMLVNAGIKIIITTHSDYIVRELNALIQLQNDRPILRRIQKDEGYSDSELLIASHIKAYIAQKDQDGVVLQEAKISQDNGMEITTLDDVIGKMNRIHEAIVWGE